MLSWWWRPINCPFSARPMIIGDGDRQGVSPEGSRCCAALMSASIRSSPGDVGCLLICGPACNEGDK
jgi:hypothetical protein